MPGRDKIIQGSGTISTKKCFSHVQTLATSFHYTVHRGRAEAVDPLPIYMGVWIYMSPQSASRTLKYDSKGLGKSWVRRLFHAKYPSYPSVFWSIGITFKESGVNVRGHINSHQDGIRGRTMCTGSLVLPVADSILAECILPLFCFIFGLKVVLRPSTQFLPSPCVLGRTNVRTHVSCSKINKGHG